MWVTIHCLDGQPVFFNKSWWTLSSDAKTFLMELPVPARSFGFGISQKTLPAITQGSQDTMFPTAVLTVQTLPTTPTRTTQPHTNEGAISLSAITQDAMTTSDVWSITAHSPMQQLVQSTPSPATCVTEQTVKASTGVSSCTVQSLVMHSAINADSDLRRISDNQVRPDEFTRAHHPASISHGMLQQAHGETDESHTETVNSLRRATCHTWMLTLLNSVGLQPETI